MNDIIKTLLTIFQNELEFKSYEIEINFDGFIIFTNKITGKKDTFFIKKTDDYFKYKSIINNEDSMLMKSYSLIDFLVFLKTSLIIRNNEI